MSIFLAIFLLFNSGLIYEVANDPKTSISLSEMDFPVFNNKEVSGAKWLHNLSNFDRIYADEYRMQLLYGFELYEKTIRRILIDDNQTKDSIRSNSYIYFGTLNVMKKTIVTQPKRNLTLWDIGGLTKNVQLEWNTDPLSATHPLIYVDARNLTNEVNEIYDNGGAQIYYR